MQQTRKTKQIRKSYINAREGGRRKETIKEEKMSRREFGMYCEFQSRSLIFSCRDRGNGLKEALFSKRTWCSAAVQATSFFLQKSSTCEVIPYLSRYFSIFSFFLFISSPPFRTPPPLFLKSQPTLLSKPPPPKKHSFSDKGGGGKNHFQRRERGALRLRGVRMGLDVTC